MDANVNDQCRLLNGYHDGQLPQSQRIEFELHLKTCPACATELATLQTISHRLASAELPPLPPRLLQRLHEYVDAHVPDPQMSILRIAEWLSGLAAAVLVVGLIGLFTASAGTRMNQPAPIAAWEQAALSMQVDTRPASTQDPTRLITWTPEEWAQQ
jgi:anti-sigma factor RsiW